ncbi:hypothetical protein POVWA2_073740 [Plasmodium ovale wallikeri]|uniref:PIR Superfamily Protein n=1 Tax=Plasmodium ovale wallikeri TaxID=864142 RepID=A0A1A9AJW3_PLAOA|nr:hypothetical protein POVWA2_073740 [Plasmodium ovale wallikeri]
MCHGLKEFCWKLEENLELLKGIVAPNDVKRRCTYINLWLQDQVINTVPRKNTIICISSLHSIGEKVKDTLADSIKNSRVANIYNEFLHVCNGTNKQRCPEYWDVFKKNYEGASEIEEPCNDIYQKLGYYKIKVYLGEQDIEEYIEQYESEYIFSFFERLIGYSIKYFLYKAMHYSKYIVLPILFILLFSFFLKKLSLFGSNIRPRVDDLRKMWRNVQGVTNPETLLNSGKPPSGGNKIG